MRLLIAFAFIFFVALHCTAQTLEPPSINTEQQLENITANKEDLETEDDAYIQQLLEYINDPINLNTADEVALKQLHILSPLQIQYFILYRTRVGKLIDIHELQSVPGWDLHTIQKVRPYLSVSSGIPMLTDIKSRLRKGDHSILVRASQVLERAKGYRTDSSTSNNFYQGSPQKYLFRYKYAYKQLLQYGIVGEKDAGEQFFKGKQKQGFDFYSAHVFLRKLGLIKSLAIGDFSVNLGQGLVQWQSLAFKKSADVVNIKREAEVLRPYNSAGEINFHRGVGITLEKFNCQLTVFGSYRKIDANLVADTSASAYGFISSLQTSGYHRTKSESADKGIQRQLAFGGNIAYRNRRLHLGINGIQYRFKLPLIRSTEPYNNFALWGNSFGNYSMNYSYTFRNVHFFGEAAFSSSFNRAILSGLIVSTSARAELSLLYRNISRGYQSLYTSAFTESAYPANETGLYFGISLRPGDHWHINAYADVYSFPWLRYRVDAPSNGKDLLVQLSYRPHKRLEIYSRYHFESKAINTNPAQLALSPTAQQPRQNWRTQVSIKINDVITVRNRTEMLWFDKRSALAEEGFLIFFDLVYQPLLKPVSASVRLQHFDTNGYNSRIYAYEKDVLYSYSIPVFYEKGNRYYININYDVNKRVTGWVKWSQTLYKAKTHIGSGLDEIEGSCRTELKLQLLYKF